MPQVMKDAPDIAWMKGAMLFATTHHPPRAFKTAETTQARAWILKEAKS